MTETAKKNVTEIDESGFEEKNGNDSNHADNISSLKSKTKTVNESENVKSKFKLNIPALKDALKNKAVVYSSVTVLCGFFVGAGYWLYTSSHTPIEELFNSAGALPNGSQSNTLEAGIATNDPSGQPGVSVTHDRNGVQINGHHDVLASMLLQNYPTHAELQEAISRITGAEVSQEELNAYLLLTKSNSESIESILETIENGNGLSGESSEKINKALSEIASFRQLLTKMQIQNDQERALFKVIKDSLASINQRLETQEKNSGWYHNRISKLEGQPVPGSQNKAAVKTTAETRRVELQSQQSWSVNAASANVAFIKNNITGKPLRVTRGFDIPGCGQVTDINPAAQKITTTACVITN